MRCNRQSCTVCITACKSKGRSWPCGISQRDQVVSVTRRFGTSAKTFRDFTSILRYFKFHQKKFKCHTDILQFQTFQKIVKMNICRILIFFNVPKYLVTEMSLIPESTKVKCGRVIVIKRHFRWIDIEVTKVESYFSLSFVIISSYFFRPLSVQPYSSFMLLNCLQTSEC